MPLADTPAEQIDDKDILDPVVSSPAVQLKSPESTKQPDYGPEEWEAMDIPHEYYPLPVLRVRVTRI